MSNNSQADMWQAIQAIVNEANAPENEIVLPAFLRKLYHINKANESPSGANVLVEMLEKYKGYMNKMQQVVSDTKNIYEKVYIQECRTRRDDYSDVVRDLEKVVAQYNAVEPEKKEGEK